MMKNVFHVISKAVFLLKIFKIFSCLFSHVKKKRLNWKDKVNFKIYDVTPWLAKNYNTHIAQYLTK